MNSRFAIALVLCFTLISFNVFGQEESDCMEEIDPCERVRYNSALFTIWNIAKNDVQAETKIKESILRQMIRKEKALIEFNVGATYRDTSNCCPGQSPPRCDCPYGELSFSEVKAPSYTYIMPKAVSVKAVTQAGKPIPLRNNKWDVFGRKFRSCTLDSENIPQNIPITIEFKLNNKLQNLIGGERIYRYRARCVVVDGKTKLITDSGK